MNDKYNNFNSEDLFKRKTEHCGYKFCPLCGSQLQECDIDGAQRMACINKACDYIFYQNPIPAAGAIIVKDDKILLVKRAYPPKIGWWCIPAGFMEWDEHPAETAVREVAEETGLQIKIADFFNVYSGHDDPRNNAVLILYLAEIIRGELKASDDALDVRFFSFDDLPEKIAFEAHRQALEDYTKRYRA